ncbi:MAG: right-handed parallel beta-helix repeat-containing protein [Gemmatimonas sp.]
MLRRSTLAAAMLAASLFAACSAVTLATAQTAAVVPKADTALLISTLPKCTTACPDSARIAWTYGETKVSRVVKAKSIDTVRVVRLNAARDAVFTYTPYKGSSKTLTVAAYVPPVVTKPVEKPVEPANPGYVVPALPATFSTQYPPTTRTLRVSGSLQAALDSAKGGDEVVLPNGSAFAGNFRLPKRADAGWVVVRCETVGAVGVRRDTTHSCAINTPNSDAALITAAGAARWRIVGVELALSTPSFAQNYGIVVLGRGNETATADLPADIVLDRVYVHSHPTSGTSRCVAFNGIRLAVIDSYLSECHGKGYDAQGVGGWGGPGPFLIQNNRIEASGQHIMFGGADPAIPNVSPSDIVIRRNHLFKPLDWARGKWTVKATFELKHARRVLLEDNVLENHWADAQVGYAILMQTVSQYNQAPWTVICDVTIRNNVIRKSSGGVNILSRYNTVPVEGTRRVLIDHNLFEEVGRDPFSGSSEKPVQLLSDLQDVTISRNTFTLTGSTGAVLYFDGAPQSRLRVTDNVFPANAYGVGGSGFGSGLPALNRFAPGAVFTGNVIPGQDMRSYPAGNSSSPIVSAGVIAAQLQAAIAGVVR